MAILVTILLRYDSDKTKVGDPYLGWNKYKGEGFTILYPAGWRVQDELSQGSILTIEKSNHTLLFAFSTSGDHDNCELLDEDLETNYVKVPETELVRTNSENQTQDICRLDDSIEYTKDLGGYYVRYETPAKGTKVGLVDQMDLILRSIELTEK